MKAETLLSLPSPRVHSVCWYSLKWRNLLMSITKQPEKPAMKMARRHDFAVNRNGGDYFGAGSASEATSSVGVN
jgi:hypothetical protein